MGSRTLGAIALLLVLAGCASNRGEAAAGARVHPGDSVQTPTDTAAPYRIRDTVPDTTGPGRRDTIPRP